MIRNDYKIRKQILWSSSDCVLINFSIIGYIVFLSVFLWSCSCLLSGEAKTLTEKYKEWWLMDSMPSVQDAAVCLFRHVDLCSAGTSSRLSNWARVYIFFHCVPSWPFCNFYPEKWIWVVVLWLTEITDLSAPNQGRRPAAPQAIERRQTAGLSSEYTVKWCAASGGKLVGKILLQCPDSKKTFKLYF